MKHRNKSWLEMAEYASLATSAAGTIVAIASQQAVYAAAPLTLALSLSVVNRQKFQHQTQLHTSRAITEVRQVAESLNQQIHALPTEPANLNPITQSLEQLEHKIQTLTQQFDNRPELQEIRQLKNQLNALALRLDDLSQPSQAVDLSAVEAEIISLQAQLRVVDPSSLNDSIALLQSHVDHINQQVENLPSPFDPGELEQRLAQLKDSQGVFGEDVNCLVSAIANLQSNINIAEQARTSQLDALVLKLENLPTPPEPPDLSEIHDAIANLNDQLDNLTQQFNTRPERRTTQRQDEMLTLAIERLEQLEQQQALGQISEIRQRLKDWDASITNLHNSNQQLKNGLEQQIHQLYQETSKLDERIQKLDKTPRQLEKIELLTARLNERTTVVDEHALNLVQIEQRIEMLQQLLFGLHNKTEHLLRHTDNIDDIREQLTNESVKTADIEGALAKLSDASATKQEIDALTQLFMEETERLRCAIAALPPSLPPFDPSPINAQIADLAVRVDNLPLTTTQQQLEEVQESIEGLDSSMAELHDRTRNLDKMQSQLENLQRSLTGYVKAESLEDTLGKLSRDFSEQVDVTVEKQVAQLNQLLKEIQPSYKYELVFERAGSCKVLVESLQKAQNRLILVCPWIGWAIDSEMIHEIEKLLNRNISVNIGWGRLQDINNIDYRNSSYGSIRQKLHSSSNYYNALPKLEDLEQRYPQYFKLKILGTHAKYLVCDNCFAMVGSHNFLTSKHEKNGTKRKEGEVGIQTNDTRIVAELIARFDKADNLELLAQNNTDDEIPF